jgi:hypothetical protein
MCCGDKLQESILISIRMLGAVLHLEATRKGNLPLNSTDVIGKKEN